MSETLARELEMIFADMVEETQQKEQAMRMTMEKMLQDMMELEATTESEREERQKETQRLEASAEIVRKEEQEKCRDSLSIINREVERVKDEREKERVNRYALEKKHRTLLFRRELKEDDDQDKRIAKETEQFIIDSANLNRWTEERENVTLTAALAAASIKQKMLKEFKHQAGKWMVRSGLFLYTQHPD